MSATLRAIALAGVLLLAAGPVHAGPCWHDTHRAECKTFLITEVGYGTRIEEDRGSFGNNSLGSWEAGLMARFGDSNAAGGTLLLGYDHIGVHLGVKPRIRRWITPSWIVDLSPGVIVAHDGRAWKSPGFTGHVGLSYRDYVALVGQVEVSRFSNFRGTETSVYVGIRIGSWPGAIAGVVAGLGNLVIADIGGRG